MNTIEIHDTQQMLVCLLNNYSNVVVTGKDAHKFLQGQLSCDLNEITETESGTGCYCNIKGRVLAYFDIFMTRAGYIINLLTNVSDKLVNALKKYAIFSKVEININHDLKTIGLYNIDEAWIRSANESISGIHILSQPSNSHKIIVNLENYEALTETFNKNGITSLNDEKQWKQILIANKVAIISEEQSEKYLPAELDLDKTKAVSFTKGCFMGQEVIARMKYIGKMKKSLHKLIITQTKHSLEGEKLTLDDKNIGEIINSVLVKADTYLALALVNNEVIENNKEIKLENSPKATIFIN